MKYLITSPSNNVVAFLHKLHQDSALSEKCVLCSKEIATVVRQKSRC